ncbi:hypothetical protein [Rhizobium ruizarguesonis]|nr:hypothetical protein [Rhizobium ruizarguesonis]
MKREAALDALKLHPGGFVVESLAEFKPAAMTGRYSQRAEFL